MQSFIKFNQQKLPNPGEFAYRYEDYWSSDVHYDWNGEPCGFGPSWSKVYCSEFEVVRFTPKGFVIRAGIGGEEKFICHHWRKKFACLNREEAMTSFIKRKERQITILSRQLRNAETALHAMKEGKLDVKVYHSFPFDKLKVSG